MKVRMQVSIAGHAMPHYDIASDFSLAPGDVLELHDELAEKWVASKHAEPVADEPEVEAKAPSEYLQTLLQKKPKRAKAQESE